jgi:hypothetical protein
VVETHLPALKAAVESMLQEIEAVEGGGPA